MFFIALYLIWCNIYICPCNSEHRIKQCMIYYALRHLRVTSVFLQSVVLLWNFEHKCSLLKWRMQMVFKFVIHNNDFVRKRDCTADMSCPWTSSILHGCRRQAVVFKYWHYRAERKTIVKHCIQLRGTTFYDRCVRFSLKQTRNVLIWNGLSVEQVTIDLGKYQIQAA